MADDVFLLTDDQAQAMRNELQQLLDKYQGGKARPFALLFVNSDQGAVGIASNVGQPFIEDMMQLCLANWDFARLQQRNRKLMH